MKKVISILIVEDDLSIRETLKDALESEGYRVVTAVNGKDGLEKIKLLPHPSLVLLDMLMPIMDGRAFLDAVLADHDLAPIPVIIVSADIEEKNKIGAKNYMKKPADLNLLLQWIDAYTHGRK
jgi:two-component system chemotaxis response regulator CheY